MKHTMKWGLGLAAVGSLLLAGCSTDSPSASPSASESAVQEPVTLTMAAWLLDSTPEFKTVTDAFTAANPDITIELIEYVAGNEYDTQMIADLAAGSAPDLYILKNLRNFFTYQDGGQLLDVSDVAAGLDANTSGLSNYQVDGVTYGVPYRQDSWYLYYDKDMFDAAGVEYPDGTWTWFDYQEAADALSAGLPAADDYGAYQHSWQSIIQGFASAQTPGADILTGDFGYMKPYYDRALEMQASGAQIDFNTRATANLTYQSQFGTQKAAMLIMGSWYVAAYLDQVSKGDAIQFDWGIAPVPQLTSDTVGTPVTFGDPTAIGINPAIDENKVAAAKKFLAFIGGEEAALALAGIGITPSYASDTVTAAYFAKEGVPTDDLSKFAFGTHDTKAENPVSSTTAQIQSILGDMHTAIMSGTTSVKDAIIAAEARVENEVS